MQSWDSHYRKEKSVLAYPDENLVRLLSRALPDDGKRGEKTAVDLGCGTGRHLKLLRDMGVGRVLGTDASLNALMSCRGIADGSLVQNSIASLSLKDSVADTVVAWGSLHYDYKSALPGMLGEIHRVLKPGGTLLATLRSVRDTFLKQGKHILDNTWQTDLNDIRGSIVSFYSEDELKEYFAVFPSLQYGIMERSIMGDMTKIISHWVIAAKK